jgi:hypothetical protein
MASTDTMSEAPRRSRRHSSRSAGKKRVARKPATRRASPRRANKRIAEDNRSMLSGMMDMAHFADDAAVQARRYVRDGARGAQRAITDAQHFASDSIDGALTIGGRYGGLLAERFREQPLATMAGLGAMAMIAAWLMGGRRSHG